MTLFNFRALSIRLMSLTLLSIILFSFSAVPGGDSFTVFLNDRLLLEQYVRGKDNAKTIALPVSNSGDVLKVNYSHCGKMGIDRKITLKDGKSKTLRTWAFTDAADGAASPMVCKVKEITS